MPTSWSLLHNMQCFLTSSRRDVEHRQERTRHTVFLSKLSKARRKLMIHQGHDHWLLAIMEYLQAARTERRAGVHTQFMRFAAPPTACTSTR